MKFGGRDLRPLRNLLFLGLAVVVGLRYFGPRSSGPPLGGAPPDFDLPIVAGGSGRVTPADLRGCPAVIEVTASFCSACRRMAPVLSELARVPRRCQAKILAVSVDDDEAMARESHARDQLAFPMAFGGAEFSQRYGIRVLPTLLVLDRDGALAYATTGPTRGATLEEWLSKLGAAPR
jgi:cytochrome c biogenesis protein CcmG, thiol:disulfide interchange protein DsbE